MKLFLENTFLHSYTKDLKEKINTGKYSTEDVGYFGLADVSRKERKLWLYLKNWILAISL